MWELGLGGFIVSLCTATILPSGGSNEWLGEWFLCLRLGFSSSIMLVVLCVACLSLSLFLLTYYIILPCLCSVVCVFGNLLSHLHFDYCLV